MDPIIAPAGMSPELFAKVHASLAELGLTLTVATAPMAGSKRRMSDADDSAAAGGKKALIEEDIRLLLSSGEAHEYQVRSLYAQPTDRGWFRKLEDGSYHPNSSARVAISSTSGLMSSCITEEALAEGLLSHYEVPLSHALHSFFMAPHTRCWNFKATGPEGQRKITEASMYMGHGAEVRQVCYQYNPAAQDCDGYKLCHGFVVLRNDTIERQLFISERGERARIEFTATPALVQRYTALAAADIIDADASGNYLRESKVGHVACKFYATYVSGMLRELESLDFYGQWNASAAVLTEVRSFKAYASAFVRNECLAGCPDRMAFVPVSKRTGFFQLDSCLKGSVAEFFNGRSYGDVTALRCRRTVVNGMASLSVSLCDGQVSLACVMRRLEGDSRLQWCESHAHGSMRISGEPMAVSAAAIAALQNQRALLGPKDIMLGTSADSLRGEDLRFCKFVAEAVPLPEGGRRALRIHPEFQLVPQPATGLQDVTFDDCEDSLVLQFISDEDCEYKIEVRCDGVRLNSADWRVGTTPERTVRVSKRPKGEDWYETFCGQLIHAGGLYSGNLSTQPLVAFGVYYKSFVGLVAFMSSEGNAIGVNWTYAANQDLPGNAGYAYRKAAAFWTAHQASKPEHLRSAVPTHFATSLLVDAAVFLEEPGTSQHGAKRSHKPFLFSYEPDLLQPIYGGNSSSPEGKTDFNKALESLIVGEFNGPDGGSNDKAPYCAIQVRCWRNGSISTGDTVSDGYWAKYLLDAMNRHSVGLQLGRSSYNAMRLVLKSPTGAVVLPEATKVGKTGVFLNLFTSTTADELATSIESSMPEHNADGSPVSNPGSVDEVPEAFRTVMRNVVGANVSQLRDFVSNAGELPNGASALQWLPLRVFIA